MIASLGDYSLALAVLAAGFAFLMGLAAARQSEARFFRAARLGVAALVGLLTLASAVLGTAFLQDQFSIKYVAEFSERAMPLGYKVAAFWAGQDGSLLLWAWMLAAMAGILAFAGRREQSPEHGITLAVLAAVLGFFAATMLFAANPFALGPAVADGRGMNPLLQHPAMILHPPFLFLGYAGCTLPFALMVGPLVTGRSDNPWLGTLRRWMVAAWLFLTIGIVLGSWWAYLELGWGGYWGWDPVENASLFPWLTATAVLHSLMGQQARGMLKIWTASLTALTFVLCILAAYVTRSGVIASVHAFPKGAVGWWFLGFLGVALVASVSLTAWRARRLKSENRLEELFSKEGVLLLTNVLLVAMLVVTLWGTLLPLPTGLFGQPQTADPSWYNGKVVPMGVALLALMAAGPLLAYGKGGAGQLWRRLRVPMGVAMAVTVAVAWATLRYQDQTVGSFLASNPAPGQEASLTGRVAPDLSGHPQTEETTRFTLRSRNSELPVVFAGAPPKGLEVGRTVAVRGQWDKNGTLAANRVYVLAARRHTWARLCLFIGVTAAVALVLEFGRALRERMRQQGENLVAASLRLVDGNHRRYGGQVVHLGMVMVLAGVAGSSLFGLQHHLNFTAKAPTQTLEGYTITCEDLLPKAGAPAAHAVPQVRGANYAAAQVTLAVSAPDGRVAEVRPERRKYDKWPENSTEVALLTSLREDFYATIVGWGMDEQQQFTIIIDARVNPLVNWIWIGTVVMSLGALLALSPRLIPLRAPQPNPAREPAVAVPGTVTVHPGK